MEQTQKEQVVEQAWKDFKQYSGKTHERIKALRAVLEAERYLIEFSLLENGQVHNGHPHLIDTIRSEIKRVEELLVNINTSLSLIVGLGGRKESQV